MLATLSTDGRDVSRRQLEGLQASGTLALSARPLAFPVRPTPHVQDSMSVIPITEDVRRSSVRMADEHVASPGAQAAASTKRNAMTMRRLSAQESGDLLAAHDDASPATPTERLVGGVVESGSTLSANGMAMGDSQAASRVQGRARREIIGRMSARRKRAADGFSAVKVLQVFGVNPTELPSSLYAAVNEDVDVADPSQGIAPLTLQFKTRKQEQQFQVHRRAELTKDSWQRRLLVAFVVVHSASEFSVRVASAGFASTADITALSCCIVEAFLCIVWLYLLGTHISRRVALAWDIAVAAICLASAVGLHISGCNAEDNYWMLGGMLCHEDSADPAIMQLLIYGQLLPWLARLDWSVAFVSLVVQTILVVTSEEVTSTVHIVQLVVVAAIVAYSLRGVAREWRSRYAIKGQLGNLSDSATRTLAFICHEIRNPLSAIVGNTEMLSDSPLDDAQAALVTDLYASCQQLHAVARDILDLTKIGYNKMAIEEVVFDPYRMARTAVAEVRSSAVRAGVRLAYTVDASTVPHLLRGDPARLLQCCFNYLSNAVKFTPAGGVVRLHVGVDERLSNNRFVLRFSVIDTGCGISAAGMKRLFQSFAQASVSVARRSGGAGLGLTIVKELAELMQGDVGVASAIGKGSTFWFTALLRGATAEDWDVAAASPLYKERLVEVESHTTGSETQIPSRTAGVHSLPPVAEAGSGHIEHGSEARAAFVRGTVSGGTSETAGDGGESDSSFVGRSPGARRGSGASPQGGHGGPDVASKLVPGGGTNGASRLSPLARVRLSALDGLPGQISPSTAARTALSPAAAAVCGIFAPADTPGRTRVVRNANSTRGSTVKPSSISVPSLRVLVVDDESTIRKFLKHALKRVGLSVDVAREGGEALRLMQKAHTLSQRAGRQGATEEERSVSQDHAPYDLVTMDIQMAPGICGPAATAQIRAWEKSVGRPPCDIIAVSSNVDEPDLHEYARVGMDAVVEKPVNVGTLLQTVQDLARRRHVLVASSEPGTLRAVVRMLSIEGHVPTAATSGDEVLDIVTTAETEGQPFELLIFDLNLRVDGGLSGAEVVRALRERGTTSPAVALTDIVERSELHLAEGFCRLLPKPVERGSLLATVASVAVARRPVVQVWASYQSRGGELA